MNYKLKDIKSAFFSALNFLPMDVTPLWKTFLDNLPEESKPKVYTCPECGLQTDGNSAHGPEHRRCYMVTSRRGGWRQLGVYDG